MVEEVGDGPRSSRRSGNSIRTWSCSTSRCPTSTASSRCAGSSPASPRSGSSSTRRMTTRVWCAWPAGRAPVVFGRRRPRPDRGRLRNRRPVNGGSRLHRQGPAAGRRAEALHGTLRPGGEVPSPCWQPGCGPGSGEGNRHPDRDRLYACAQRRQQSSGWTPDGRSRSRPATRSGPGPRKPPYRGSFRNNR